MKKPQWKVTVQDLRPGKEGDVQEYELDELEFKWRRDQLTYVEVIGHKVGIFPAQGILTLSGTHAIPMEFFPDDAEPDQ